MTKFLEAEKDVKICGSLRTNSNTKFMQAYGEIDAPN